MIGDSMKKAVFGIVMLLGSQAFADSKRLTLIVEGMTCASCAGAIEKQLRNQPEVESVKISVNTGTVTVASKEGKKLSPEQIKKAVEAAGYKVKAVEELK